MAAELLETGEKGFGFSREESVYWFLEGGHLMITMR
jgi:hypothetical protein